MYSPVDKAFKLRLANIKLNGVSVPVYIADPDADIKKVVVPSITVSLYDTVNAPDREDNVPIITYNNAATPIWGYKKPSPEAWDLYYQITVYSGYESDDRSLMEQVHRTLPTKTYLNVTTMSATPVAKSYDMWRTGFIKADIMGEKRLFKKILSYVVAAELDFEDVTTTKVVQERVIDLEQI